MPVSKKFAALLVEHTATPGPTIAQARDLLLLGHDSIVHYWQQNSDGWFEFPVFDFFGPFRVNLPAPPPHRSVLQQAARAAAAAMGIDLSIYDHCVLIFSPGEAGGTGYDGGTWGSDNVMKVSNSHSSFAHEMGHLFGFADTYGILTTGADWDGDGQADLNPEYGDSYDIMSAETFGGSNPTLTLPAFAGFPSTSRLGPMVSRAALHYYHPLALEVNGRVVHCFGQGNNPHVDVYPPGSAFGNNAELLVYHPVGEDEQGRGRVYVEFRQPFTHFSNTRWVLGLEDSGNVRDRRGVVVHVVRDELQTNTPVVWYSGHISFPTPDTDIVVDTTRGSAVISVSEDDIREHPPGLVRVHVDRHATPHIHVAVTSEDVSVVTYSEMRPIPGWEFAGTFTWERRETTRTTRYRPAVGGLGGLSPIDAAASINVYWYVGNAMLVPDSGTTTVMASQTQFVTLNFSVDQTSRELTLTNRPSDGTYTVPIEAHASDEPTWRDPIIFPTTYSVEGVAEGWGEDYRRFMDYWYHITHPIPIPHIGPPIPDDYRIAIDSIYRAFDDLEAVSPSVAERMRPAMVEQVRVLRRMIQ